MLASRQNTVYALGPLACFLLSMLACSCGGKQNQPADGGTLPRVKLQLNWVAEPEFGGFYAAAQQGLFRAAGLDVELVQGGPGVPAPQLVASGQVEFAVVAGPQILQLKEQGGDLVALFAVYQGNPLGLMVHEDSPHKTLAQLWQSDTTVSIESGLADFRWLDKVYPGSKHQIVTYSASLAEFATNAKLAAQCFITSEPVSLELKGIKTRVFMMGESGFDPYNAVIVTKRSYWQANQARCAALVRACAKGWRCYLDDPTPTNEAMRKHNSGMSLLAMQRAAAIQRRLVETDDTKRLGLGCMTAARWQLTTDQLSQLGQIKIHPEPDSLFVWDQNGDITR